MKIRKELKFEISYTQYKKLKQVLDIVMKKDIHSDENGEYQVKSMYFDNHLNEVLNNKLNQINSIKKYRIRMYNNDENTIFLERKTNENGFTEKIKQKIEKKDVVEILNGNYKNLLEEEESLKTELYLNLILKQYRPAILIEYTRIAYRDLVANVSITIDREIKSTRNCNKFFEKILSSKTDSKIVLEIKYNKHLPEHIRKIIQSLDVSKTKSKFLTQSLKYV